jgi:hypothetical protein
MSAEFLVQTAPLDRWFELSVEEERDLHEGMVGMRSALRKVVFLGSLLGVLAASRSLLGRVPERNPANQMRPDAGTEDSAKLVSPDAGAGQMPGLAPADNHLSPVDAGLSDIAAASVNADAIPGARDTADSILQLQDAGEADGEQIIQSHAADLPVGAESSKQGEDMSVAATAVPVSPKRLPIFGLMADVGVPDGFIGSLAIRPWKWLRFCAGGGSNSISYGWRTGITLLPFGQGPSASLEYGGYLDGDANAMAKTLGYGSSPVLQRVGYQYTNAHLGLDFGSRRFVFFLHGGVSVLWGQIHNLNAVIPAPTASDASVTGTTQLVVPQDPNARVVTPSVKLGFVVYVR